MRENSYKKILDSNNNRYRLRSTRDVLNNEPEVRAYGWKSSHNIFNVENSKLKSLPKFN